MESVVQKPAEQEVWSSGAPVALMDSTSNVALLSDPDPDRLLRRRELAAALKRRGYPSTEASLATMVTRGGGPPMRYFGRIPLYRWADALAWAHARLSEPRTSSSEADAPKAAA